MGLFKKKEIYEDNTYQDYDNYGVNVIDLGEEKETKTIGLINIIFIIIIACMIMIVTDTIAVTKYQTGPFFAIRTQVYKDGGTSVYHGLGYKVIKYAQTEGRQDIEIGPWSMKYSTTTIDMPILDLAIQLRNYPEKTYKSLAGKMLKVTGAVSNVDKENNKITIKYIDSDGAYTLEVIAILHQEEKNIASYQKGKEISLLGTVSEFKVKTNTTPNKLYMKNVYVQ